jgi:hypothetical protein
MLRTLALLLLAAAPAHAWTFTPVPLCTVTHDAAEGMVRVTHDPRQPAPYAITVTAPAPWPAAPSFAIRFDGPFGQTLATTRHSLSEDGLAVTVNDSGFGNVLDGLEFNATATAISGDTALTLSLDGAAPAIAAFRACATAPSV